MRCLYEVLGVEKDVDEIALKAAYKKAAFRWHPGNICDPSCHRYAMLKRTAYYCSFQVCDKQSPKLRSLHRIL